VIPGIDYCIFVRFKFSAQAYIDSGAVAWPGNIDLAPDAMYARVASQRDREMQAS
jgi:hypothetical protein